VSVRAVPTSPGDGSSRERAAAALRRSTGALSSAAMSRMLTDVPWFAELSAESRSWVGQILHAGIQGFVDWFRLGDDNAFPGDTAAAVFGAAPRSMTGVITLGQTVDLVTLTDLAAKVPAGSGAAVMVERSPTSRAKAENDLKEALAKKGITFTSD